MKDMKLARVTVALWNEHTGENASGLSLLISFFLSICSMSEEHTKIQFGSNIKGKVAQKLLSHDLTIQYNTFSPHYMSVGSNI